MNSGFDLVVLGAGPAGYAAALRSAELGQKIALIEKDKPGGLCLWQGCIPTKIFLHHLKLFKKALSKKNFGILLEGQFSWPRLVSQKNDKLQKIGASLEGLLKKHRVELIRARGRLLNNHEVEAAGQKLTAEKIIAATGSRPILPESFSYDGEQVITSDEALNLEKVPQKIVIIGAGPVGCEFAAIFSILGAEVVLVEALGKILPEADDDLSAELSRQCEKSKVKITVNSPVEKIQKEARGVKVFLKNGTMIEAKKALVALGRKGNLEGLEILASEKGFIKTNQNFKTNLENVYALGDLVGPPLLAHKASYSGKKLAEFLAGKIKSIPQPAVPFGVFSFLEVAAVGLTQKEAAKQNLDFGVIRLPFGVLGLAQALEENEGFVKVIFDKKNQKILGIHLIGQHASFLLGQAVTLIETGATLETLDNLLQAHPTFGEILGSVPEFNWL